MTIHSPTPGQLGATPCDDTRRLAWLATELAYDWSIGAIDIAELACAYADDAGREEPIDADVIDALRRAIDTMIAIEAAGAGGGGA